MKDAGQNRELHRDLDLPGLGIKPTDSYLRDIWTIAEEAKHLRKWSEPNVIKLQSLHRRHLQILRLYRKSFKYLNRELRDEAPADISLSGWLQEVYKVEEQTSEPLKLPSLVDKLSNAGMSNSDIRRIFAIALADQNATDLSTRNIWKPWLQVLKEKERIVCRWSKRGLPIPAGIVPRPKWITDLSEIMVLRRHSPRSHSNWTALIASLIQKLRHFYEPRRQWEQAGGVAKNPVTPQEVFDVTAEILSLCYPKIWNTNSKTVQDIKMRFHSLKQSST